MTTQQHADDPVLIASSLAVPPPRQSSLAENGTARAALDAAVGHLRSLQHPDGWWKGELATNVTMDAEDLMLRTFLRIGTDQTTVRTARWIRSQQRSDGTWALYPNGPADLSTTIEAWVALRIAGDPAEADHLQKAAAFVRESGGLENARVFTHMWLALFGLWRWDDCPTLPPELMLLPRRAPLNIYNWACWARQTIVPLTIVSSRRPVRQLGIRVDELLSGAPQRRSDPLWTVAGAFERLDRGLRVFGKLLPAGRNPVRRLAERQAAEWILARQEADGGWGGIQPPWVYSLLALHLMGYPVDHPAMAAGLQGLEGFTVHGESDEGPVRWLEACQSPVWDTGLALGALLDAGVPGNDPAVVAAAGWLLDKQITVGGDWQVRRPDLVPGGWAFEFANDNYPDTDDTAEIVMALRRVRHPDCERLNKAIDRAITWTVGMQSADGGWGAFDADNSHELALALPFCDFGAVIDPPSADVTAHVVEMMATAGLADTPACRRGVAWLLDAQEADGSWFGRWGANHVYGTGAVVPALIAAGVPAHDPHIRWATEWLRRHQNADGGWGEDLRSYDDPSWIGRGESTPSQTAWALLALLAAGDSSESVERGVGHLVTTQRPDGSWGEELYTGTGFPDDFYIGYGLYRQVFPIWALGRYLAGVAGESGRG